METQAVVPTELTDLVTKLSQDLEEAVEFADVKSALFGFIVNLDRDTHVLGDEDYHDIWLMSRDVRGKSVPEDWDKRKAMSFFRFLEQPEPEPRKHVTGQVDEVTKQSFQTPANLREVLGPQAFDENGNFKG